MIAKLLKSKLNCKKKKKLKNININLFFWKRGEIVTGFFVRVFYEIAYFKSSKITINIAINTAIIHVDPNTTEPLLAGKLPNLRQC